MAITTARKDALAASYGTNGCINDNSVILAIHDDIFNNNRLTEEEIQWIYTTTGYCQSGTPTTPTMPTTPIDQTIEYGEAVIYDIVSGSILQILSCEASETCSLSALSPTQVHMYKIDSSASEQAAIDWLQGQIPSGTIVDIVSEGTDTSGLKAVSVFKNGINMNDALVASGYARSGNYTAPTTPATTTKSAVFYVNPALVVPPATIRPGMNNWFRATVKNNGNAYGKCYLGIKLTDANGQVYEYPGDITYAKGFQPGESFDVRALVPVPSNLVGQIKISIIIHRA